MTGLTYQIYTEPFIHMIVSPPIELYEYANSIFPEPPTLIEGYRTNIDLHDEQISNFIRSSVDRSLSEFSNEISVHYPKLNLSELRLKDRYLWSHNTPSTKENVVRGMHLDNGTKLITGLWYFKEVHDQAGGNLFLANPLTRKTKILEYSTNCMILFPNLPTSWHAVTKRKPTTISRRFINIVRESDTFLHSYNKVTNEEPKDKVINFFA